MTLLDIKRNQERLDTFLNRVATMLIPNDRREQRVAEMRRTAFDRVMHEARWGENLSGPGSTVEYTLNTRANLLHVIREYGIDSMLDAGCGDIAWLPLVLEQLPSSFSYTGIDIVHDLISQHKSRCPQHQFEAMDFVNDKLPKADLIFCRDAIQHLPIRDALAALQNFSRSGARYLLTSTHPRCYGRRNGRDRRAGQCHDRNLMLKPFSLADPIVILSERDPAHKFLGLWPLPLETVNGDILG